MASKADDSFWNREREANATRKKSLDDLPYISIDFTALPLESNSTDAEIAESISSLKHLAEKTICNLSPYTNTDLKLMYGVANIPLLTEYDQNFTLLITLLQKWAERLNALSDMPSAASVLEYSISVGSDISASYKMLGEYYLEHGSASKNAWFLEQMEALPPISRDRVKKNLSSLLSLLVVDTDAL